MTQPPPEPPEPPELNQCNLCLGQSSERPAIRWGEEFQVCPGCADILTTMAPARRMEIVLRIQELVTQQRSNYHLATIAEFADLILTADAIDWDGEEYGNDPI